MDRDEQILNCFREWRGCLTMGSTDGSQLKICKITSKCCIVNADVPVRDNQHEKWSSFTRSGCWRTARQLHTGLSWSFLLFSDMLRKFFFWQATLSTNHVLHMYLSGNSRLITSSIQEISHFRQDGFTFKHALIWSWALVKNSKCIARIQTL